MQPRQRVNDGEVVYQVAGSKRKRSKYEEQLGMNDETCEPQFPSNTVASPLSKLQTTTTMGTHWLALGPSVVRAGRFVMVMLLMTLGMVYHGAEYGKQEPSC